jgi:hypothetical protein
MTFCPRINTIACSMRSTGTNDFFFAMLAYRPFIPCPFLPISGKTCFG